MKWITLLLLMLVPRMVPAQGMPQALAAQVQRDPTGYLEDVAVLIAGYGRNGAIDALGLQNVVAMERADARAMALRRLQGADLNGDGAIGGDEMRIKAAALASAARGRLIVYFGKADLDRDSTVSADELQTYANLVALQDFSDEKAAKIYAVMGFDQNGDAWVSVAEVRAALALTGSGPQKLAPQKIEDKFKI